ncbi:RICIN domain-containing protein [Umezawaea tangerina]|uniref:Ricin-type beta-trefoil lectin protein n=1 Tax=Umezawaea tangerina TaxID=84725 RepID=A0A2T0TJ98_9PSEU|nr:RICIN domain-containing protein [Umezawaea tangerina]PRY45743.1 ricin-type beta-trefoil lectin protein [Umezawaea tangerina]
MNALLRKTSRLLVLAAGLALCLVAPTAASADQSTADGPRVLEDFRTIVSWHTGTCVDVDGASQASGTKVQIYTCNGTVAQLWEKLPTDSGYFRLRVAASGQCMAVKDASQAEAAPVVQNPCNLDFNQQWKEGDSGVPGFPQLVARHSGKVLIMRSEALADRTPLIQVTYSGSDPLHSTAWQFR